MGRLSIIRQMVAQQPYQCAVVLTVFANGGAARYEAVVMGEVIGSIELVKRVKVDKHVKVTSKGRVYTKTVEWWDVRCLVCGHVKPMTMENIKKRLKAKAKNCNKCHETLGVQKRQEVNVSIFSPPINIELHNRFISQRPPT